ncbi:GbsR/MarR family transcriptional regulator [Aquibacillus albus]|uniref:HTH-type transcriptional regulator n=1 Tax=Aquibacillus albus TaxID=1168171 RepID=A0ABS2MX60_9BACI|nr:GbsR/MarR family transcriptional regulator [Aquibacillus albus]MBM7570493.1 DNA-binding transcriptional regulator GbsR (MarR family) [Aquibacillus albus]
MDSKTEERFEQIRSRIIEQIAANMKLYGVPSTVGRLMGTIYYNRGPMTLDDMTEELGMSKTRMSQAVRELLELQLAEKVFEKGVRKDIYNVEQDYYQTFISLFSSNWRKGISMNRSFQQKLIIELNELIHDENLEEDAKEKAQEYLDETQSILDFYHWLNRLVEFFESNEIFKHVPKTEDLPEKDK